MKMDYVYCTRCGNFGIMTDLTPVCNYSDVCDLHDPEDGRRLYMRPYYTPMDDNVRSKRAVIITIPNKDGTVDYFIQRDLLDNILCQFSMDDGVDDDYEYWKSEQDAPTDPLSDDYCKYNNE